MISRVLGIETSCDETAVALYDAVDGLLTHEIYSQIPVHRIYGGVVPELASRDHIQKLTPMIENVLKQANSDFSTLDGIAYTNGPGLIGALMIGATIGQSLAWALNIPSIGIHHMEGHLLAPMLEQDKPDFPFLALLVSGGHTLLVHVESLGKYNILGQSIDDAVGEAFDKTAKCLGLDYPGGPAIAKLAKTGNAEQYNFPRPMTKVPGLDFSFSGLKTHVLTTWKQSDKSDKSKADIAAAFEKAAIETLAIKCKRALKTTQLKTLVVAGGVGANEYLRIRLNNLMQEIQGKVYFPRQAFCTDNAAMIAYCGYLRLKGHAQDNLSIKPKARWPLDELTPP